MPNTPAQVCEGMTAICFDNEKFTPEEKNMVCALFESVGKIAVLPERLMDAAVVANGRSPAFVYIFMEALADGAVKFGIPRATAYEMVAQTVIGSAKMLLETGEHPGKLKDNVCSPGGTTIAAVAALEEAGFRNAITRVLNDYARTNKILKDSEYINSSNIRDRFPKYMKESHHKDK